MDREGLLRELAVPRSFELPREIWEVSAILAGLRERANDPIRARDRDRGRDKNWLADIWGVLGEIMAVRIINAICKEAPIRHHPIDFERSVDVVDIVVDVDDGPVKLETKAHLLDGRKQWFMVNRRAHERSMRRGAEGYIPVISALGASRVHVGRLLIVDELESWGPPDKALKDPAIGVRLNDLSTRHFDRSLEVLSGSLSGKPMIARIARQAGADFDNWRLELPALGQKLARAVRDAVLQARDRIDGAHHD